MNSKILIAFVAGAVIASGIVFMAVRPEETTRPAPVVVTAKPPAPPPAPQVAVEEPVPTPAPPPAPVTVHEKPSPLRPPPRREKPVIIARDERPMQVQTPPPPPPAPAPVPEPAPEPAPLPAPTPEQPAPLPQVETPQPPQTPEPVPETRVPNTVTIHPGTVLVVRIAETISAARHEVGDTFLATLEQPLVIDGFIIAERGSRAEGRIVEALHPGRGPGSSRLGIELVRLSTSDGQRVHIQTGAFQKEAGSSAGSDLAKVGVGAAIGAAIGAAAGGGKGAAIGAGVGGAAGTADVLLTRGKAAEIPVETRVSFRIQEPITLTERLQ